MQLQPLPHWKADEFLSSLCFPHLWLLCLLLLRWCISFDVAWPSVFWSGDCGPWVGLDLFREWPAYNYLTGLPYWGPVQILQMFFPVMVVTPKEVSFSLWPGGRKPKSRHSHHRRRQMLGIRVCMYLAVSGDETFSLLYGRNELVPFGSLWPNTQQKLSMEGKIHFGRWSKTCSSS